MGDALRINSIRTSADLGEIAAAFSRAQKKFGAAIKSSQNPAYRSKYADLSAVIDAVLEHLNAEDIGVMQWPSLDGQMATVTTRLQHKSGQWMEGDLSIPAVQRERFDAQSVGSAITYGSRYALQSVCCIPREDDDGNSAAGVGTKEAAQQVGERKVAEFKEKKAKANGHKPVDCLFYTLPDRFAGHRAVLINLKQYGESIDQVAKEGLWMILKKYVQELKDGTGNFFVPSDKVSALEAELGECSVPLRKVQATD